MLIFLGELKMNDTFKSNSFGMIRLKVHSVFNFICFTNTLQVHYK